MSRRFFELVVRARRLVGRPRNPSLAPSGSRLGARRQLGAEVTQFSFRLAFMMDLAYVGIGALGGAAVGRASVPSAPPVTGAAACRADSVATPGAVTPPNAIPSSARSTAPDTPLGVIR